MIQPRQQASKSRSGPYTLGYHKNQLLRLYRTQTGPRTTALCGSAQIFYGVFFLIFSFYILVPSVGSEKDQQQNTKIHCGKNLVAMTEKTVLANK